LYNVQHDCTLAQCTASGRQAVMQERVESGLINNFIEHKPIARFVINTHAFHNAHLLRATLPRSLVAPIQLYQDRQTKHIELAGRLRPAQEAKRTATKTRAAQKKQVSVNATNATVPDPSERARLDTQGNVQREYGLTDVVDRIGPALGKRARLEREGDIQREQAPANIADTAGPVPRKRARVSIEEEKDAGSSNPAPSLTFVFEDLCPM